MSALSAARETPPVTTPAAQDPPPAPKFTVPEYLERERQSEVRHEYVNGVILAMAGETPRHNRIAGNVYLKLETEFGDRPCTAFFEGVRVRVSPTQYRYPDVTALCGDPQFDADNPPSLLNPTVIVEVLSASTEGTDRGEKFSEYRQLVGLTDYILVTQEEPLVIHYARQSPTRWEVVEYTTLSERLTIASLEVSLSLADIYRKIDFPAHHQPS